MVMKLKWSMHTEIDVFPLHIKPFPKISNLCSNVKHVPTFELGHVLDYVHRCNST